ncbi:MAG: hypothetical protein ABFC34_05390 [Methanobacterium sp.]
MTSIVLKKYLLAPIDVIYERLVGAPIIFLSLLLLFLHFSVETFIVLALSAVGSILWSYYYVNTKYNCRKYTEMLLFLDEYSNCNFELYRLEDILIEKFKIYESFLNIFQTGLLSIVFSNQIRKSNLGWLCVSKRKNTGEIYSYHSTAFLCMDKPSYIIITDSPDEINHVQLFAIFHELGHLCRNQQFIREMYTRNKIQGLCLILLVIVIANWNTIAIIIAFFAFLFWAASGNIICTTYDRLELDADSFAIFSLINHPQFESIERLVKRVRKNSLKKETVEEVEDWFERSKNWALNPITITSDPVKNSFYNYTACTERLRITPLIIRLIMGILIVSTVLFSKEPSILGLLILFFAFVVIPFYLVIEYKIKENRLHSIVEMELHGKTSN